MDEVQALLMVGLVFTVGFAGYLMLDSQQGIEQLELEQDPHWPILDVCLDSHSEVVEHYHVTLSIIIDGSNVEIPADTGIQDEFCPDGMRGIHTHDSTGKLHIETPDQENGTIGAFFAIWNQTFNQNQILDNQANSEFEIIMEVNGQQNNEYQHYLMHDGDQIEIRYQVK